MKETQLLMNGPMVRATLDGYKTTTRRTNGLEYFSNNEPDNWRCVRVAGGYAYFVYGNSPVERAEKCPYGQVGDRLWVRETWRGIVEISPPDAVKPEYGVARYVPAQEHCQRVEYAATGKRDADPWRPSIHMPRWACRILLEVNGVRVERLQAGEGETAFESRYLAEGIRRIDHGRGEYFYSAFRDVPHPQNYCDPFDAWRELWTGISGADGWDANPWVWVIEFRKVK